MIIVELRVKNELNIMTAKEVAIQGNILTIVQDNTTDQFECTSHSRQVRDGYYLIKAQCK